MVVAVPIPEEHAAEGRVIQQAQDQALAEAAAQRVSGAATTPFLLDRVRTLTGDRSLEANIQLVMNNARTGAELAVAVAAATATGQSRL